MNFDFAIFVFTTNPNRSSTPLKFLFAFFAIFLPQQIFGAQYEELKNLTGEIRNLADRVSLSTFGFQTNNLNGLTCSAFLIGQNGEALTNLHCVEQCLLDANAYTEALAYPKPVFTDPIYPANQIFLKKILTNVTSTKPINCPSKIVFNGIESNGIVQISHVFGPGFLSPRSLLSNLHISVKAPRRFGSIAPGFSERSDDGLNILI